MNTEMGDKESVSEEELGWWVALGAGVESRQHLDAGLRTSLQTCLGEASGKVAKWAFEPCVRLGLWDEAWKIEDEGWHGVSYDQADRFLDGYARWLLGNGSRPPPTRVTRWVKETAVHSLGRTAVLYKDTSGLLLELASQRKHPLRQEAISALSLDFAD